MEIFEFEETPELWDHYVTLRRGRRIRSTPISKPEDEVEKPECPYKKGTRKFRMFKKLNKLTVRPSVSRFHDKRLKNFAIMEHRFNNDTHAATFTTKLRGSDEVDAKQNHGKDTSFIVNCGDDIFIRLSYKSYRKLAKLRKVMMISSCVVRDDGSTEDDTLYHETRMFDSINGLLRALTEERIRCDCIYETQIKYCGYSLYDFRYKIMTLDKNGRSKFYNDINQFCRCFNLNLV